MRPAPLYTVGYEGTDLATFIACLRESNVATLVDVRELPMSRKRGFGKSALASELREAGIDYVHMRSLGCPREVRLRYRADRSWARYTRDFLAYLATQREAVEDLASLAEGRTCCVMCFEADFAACHRTYVARAAHRVGGPRVMHLRVGAAPIADPELRIAP
jgi:uncharacterized protein (DUF488 family)